jgi:hypothetical protein
VNRRASSATTFDNLNYLGTSDLQTNAGQTLTATRPYDALGNLIASTGTPVGPLGFVGAQGYQEDGDRGLKLLGHRYSTGRFLTRDLAKDGRDGALHCGSGPVTSIDPSWLNEEDRQNIPPGPNGPPPIGVPGDPTNGWKWVPNPKYDPSDPTSWPGGYKPKRPVKGTKKGGQPSVSKDPAPGSGDVHWDVDDGQSNRYRVLPNGQPMPPGMPHSGEPTLQFHPLRYWWLIFMGA